jgi:hypothetical protein
MCYDIPRPKRERSVVATCCSPDVPPCRHHRAYGHPAPRRTRSPDNVVDRYLSFVASADRDLGRAREQTQNQAKGHVRSIAKVPNHGFQKAQQGSFQPVPSAAVPRPSLEAQNWTSVPRLFLTPLQRCCATVLTFTSCAWM